MDLAGFIGRRYEGDFYCRVFARELLAAHGIPMPDVAEPAQAGDWQRVTHPQALDVVVFNRGGQPAHVGVCTGPGMFVHADRGHTSRIERLDSPLHANRIEGFYRYTP